MSSNEALLIDKIYECVRDDIIAGKKTPGEKLIERVLKLEFRVSNTPIREALRRLEAEGLLFSVPRRGTFVSKLSIEEVKEIYEIRAVLEGFSARMAAINISRDDVVYLRKLQKELELSARTRDHDSWHDKNGEFHFYLTKLSGNSNLHNLVVNLKKRVFRYHKFSTASHETMTRYAAQHRKIVDAVIEGDGKRAEKEMIAHLTLVKEEILRFLKDFPI
jgi:DNA-binding GntR family transcriptional regulator